jgi:NRPS condensation-like uncharacterized protein
VFVTAQTEQGFELFKVESIDAYSDPQIRVCLWNPSGDARLLIKVCHHVADVAGVKDVARVISSIYLRLSADPNYRPEPNLKGLRGVCQVLRV